MGPVRKLATPTKAAHTIEYLFMFPPQLLFVDFNRHIRKFAGTIQI
jgi:hypothetical protein